MTSNAMTLRSFLLEEEKKHPRPDPDFEVLLEKTAQAARGVERELRRAALIGILGLAGETNASGDAQKKLDVLANDLFLEEISSSPALAGVVSEEIDEVRPVSGGEQARYILATDPLDGSLNTDINGVVGTIFGYYRRQATGACRTIAEELGGGIDLAAAGYIMYGPSTILVYTRGTGVHGFTLEHELGEFMLSHHDMRCPPSGEIYSANLGKYNGWELAVRRYADHLIEKDPATRRPYTLRYVGALVADFHRSMINGGIFFYPADASSPEGKLRLLYECAPLAFIAEQAGGAASTGRGRVLDVRPRTPHQRVPIAIGSRQEVELYEKFLSGAEI